ncbi:MAG: DNA-directed RNA polymerase subunit alpha [Rickettsiales bacterium]|jgi:DNA-directed RNA polymerase subunit alpha|nr:DNA-directed RNA polymerase subunit alpha [Rickettsiales bacterium]
MAILQENWKDLIVPNLVNVEYKDRDKRRAVVVLEPLERGYGITLGNSLRRILLSSIRGFAVTSLKIDGVLHEYSVIGGIREDITDIIMNVKSLIINKPTPSSTIIKLKLNKKGPIYAKDIELNNGVEILNPNLVICHVEDSHVNLNVEMNVEYGAGYSTAEGKRDSSSKEISTIYLDALFSPIRNVTHMVENARVGQQTDYDRLIIEIETNGTIKPENAISVAAKILQTQLNVFLDFGTGGNDFGRSGYGTNGTVMTEDLDSKLNKRIDEMELSVRSYNCLLSEGIMYLGDLVRKNESEMLRLPNFGRKSLSELKENLRALGLSFDMKIGDDWIPRDRIIDDRKKK